MRQSVQRAARFKMESGRLMRGRPCLFLILALLTGRPASGAPAAELEKKIIEWGWDTTNAYQIANHIREIERNPFDGLVIQWLKAKKNGKEVTFEWEAFGRTRFEREELAQTIRVLKDIKFQRFTDNFIRFNVTPGDVDWFDDFSPIIHNARLWAEIAKETGMKGWMFDVEDYKGRVFDYRKLKYASRKTFRDYAQQARRRGREIMEAVQGAYPNIVILLALAHSYCLEAGQRPRGLKGDAYGLLPAFLNGMVEAAGPEARLIDGNEKAYGYLTSDDYYRGFHAIRQRALALVPPEIRPKYRSKVEAGMALYVNYVFALSDRPRAYPTYYMTPDERRRLFEHNVYYALTTTDEYVWCYSEGLGWWEKGYPHALPDGAIDAIRSAKAKVSEGRPLGFDVTDLVSAARTEMARMSAAQWPSRKATVQRIRAGDQPPVIDGAIDDPVWKSAPPLEPFMPLRASEAEKAEAAAVAQVAFDDKHLYIAFRCSEPDPARLHIVGKKKDDEIWRGDDVEVFMSTGESGLPYAHFIVNPRGIQWDGRCVERAGESDAIEWNAEWRAATRVGDGEWTAEIALPWSAIGGRPAPGAVRRANLCRQRASTGELTSWSPVFRMFLEPEHFGVWEFP